ncbi:copper resistance protein CopC [Streptomyces sp. NPDC007264]|uniref:copper resistance CopC family protein n=1 Tax=Streptomyces sp. NPDC007264 TaxID=3364777 RepID=UPI0036D80E3F
MKRRSPSRPPRPVRLPVVPALLLAVLSVLLPASPASAHAQLLGSSPAADSVVAKAPTTVTLRFDGPVNQRYTTVAVTGPDGSYYSDGEPSAVNGDVRQRVRALPTGTIQVTWRTVAADGAPLQGRFTFTSTDKAAAAAARPSPPPTTAPSAPAARASSSPSSSPSRPVGSGSSGGTADWAWWAAAGVLVAFVVALLAVGTVRSRRSAR